MDPRHTIIIIIIIMATGYALHFTSRSTPFLNANESSIRFVTDLLRMRV